MYSTQDELARKSLPAIENLPEEVRLGMRAACLVYLDVGGKIRQDLLEGKVTGRSRVSKWRRFGALVQSIG